MRLRAAIAICSLVLGLSLQRSPASAWNAAGHELISLVAYGQMEEATRAKALDLLRSHPRFAEHFEGLMPRAVASADHSDQDAWRFAYASTWPDLVRDTSGAVHRADVDRFNRPWWHFINIPIFLNEEDGQRLGRSLRINLEREPPAELDDPEMNVIQAIKNSSRIVGDANAPKENRAVHLCWLLHLVGDSHQPLHSSALYTVHRFRDGDHGGNYLFIEHDWKLHAFWDEQVSTDATFEMLVTSADVLQQNPELTAIGREAAASLDPGTWIDECHELAKRYVYTPEVLEKVAAREGHSHLGPLDLPASYKSGAEEIAERRAIEAAYRLAALLGQLLE
jgi:hypothetical protein